MGHGVRSSNAEKALEKFGDLIKKAFKDQLGWDIKLAILPEDESWVYGEYQGVKFLMIEGEDWENGTWKDINIDCPAEVAEWLDSEGDEGEGE